MLYDKEGNLLVKVSGLGDLNNLTKLDFADFKEVTIVSGVIIITQTCHTVDTEGDAANDDLDTINGGTEGNVIILRAENDARTVVIRHNTGNIWLQGKADISLDDIRDAIILAYDGIKWIGISSGGIANHGALTGLLDDDHTQYLNNVRHDTVDRHTLGTVVPHDSFLGLSDTPGSYSGLRGKFPVINPDENALIFESNMALVGGATRITVKGGL